MPATPTPVTALDASNVSTPTMEAEKANDVHTIIVSASSYLAPLTIQTNRLTIVIPAILLGVFVATLDQTIIATALPIIATDLGATSGYSWPGTACASLTVPHPAKSADLLTSAAMSPVYAAAASIFGRKSTLFACYLVFAIGSACVLPKTSPDAAGSAAQRRTSPGFRSPALCREAAVAALCGCFAPSAHLTP